jgi:hypothetical protein
MKLGVTVVALQLHRNIQPFVRDTRQMVSFVEICRTSTCCTCTWYAQVWTATTTRIGVATE